MQEPVTPQVVVNGTTTSRSSGAAADAAMFTYMPLTPVCKSRATISSKLLKEEAPPPLQMLTLKNSEHRFDGRR
jgi:hypothetical protein